MESMALLVLCNDMVFVFIMNMESFSSRVTKLQILRKKTSILRQLLYFEGDWMPFNILPLSQSLFTADHNSQAGILCLDME